MNRITAVVAVASGSRARTLPQPAAPPRTLLDWYAEFASDPAADSLRQRSDYRTGLYSPTATERTYAELPDRAAGCLAQGESRHRVNRWCWTRRGMGAEDADPWPQTSPICTTSSPGDALAQALTARTPR